MADWPATNMDYSALVVSQAAQNFFGGPNEPNIGLNSIPLASSLLFKNRGVYNGAFEFWVSRGQPSATPPSGHAVTDYCWEPLQ